MIQVLATDLTIGDKLKGLAYDTAQLAVPSQASIQAFKHGFKDHPLGLLLNIVGAISPKEQDSLETVDEKVLTNTFSVNTFGPCCWKVMLDLIFYLGREAGNRPPLEGRLSTLLTQALLPNLLKSNKPRIGVVSSRVSSIGDNSTGGSYAYRALKAALNSIFKGMAMDLKDKNVVAVIMHPGFVRTGLDPSTHALGEAMELNKAAEKLWEVLMSKRIEETGRIWQREGQELPSKL